MNESKYEIIYTYYNIQKKLNARNHFKMTTKADPKAICIIHSSDKGQKSTLNLSCKICATSKVPKGLIKEMQKLYCNKGQRKVKEDFCVLLAVNQKRFSWVFASIRNKAMRLTPTLDIYGAVTLALAAK